MITESARNGRGPGSQYTEATVKSRRDGATTILITWGSDQGFDEEHGRDEFARDSLGGAREAALQSMERDSATARLVERACAQAARRIARRK